MRGVSLIEILCVVGMLSIVAAFSLYASIGALVRIQSEGDVITTAAALRSARVSAMHSCSQEKCGGRSQGVLISTSTLTVLRSNGTVVLPLAHGRNLQEVFFGADGTTDTEFSILFGSWAVHILSDGSVAPDAGN